jgi:hypothetical protein
MTGQHDRRVVLAGVRHVVAQVFSSSRSGSRCRDKIARLGSVADGQRMIAANSASSSSYDVRIRPLIACASGTAGKARRLPAGI